MAINFLGKYIGYKVYQNRTPAVSGKNNFFFKKNVTY